MYDKNNIFAKIIRGEIPSKKIYENKSAISFYNINPKSRVHVLVIPKGEYIDLLDFTKNASAIEQSQFWDAVRCTADALGVSNEFRLTANFGEYQSVMHFHIHLSNDESHKNDL